MILRRLTAWAEDVNAVRQGRCNRSDRREMPVVISKPVRDSAPGTCDHVEPDALPGDIGLRRLMQEVSDETSKDHHGDPVVSGLHS